MVTATSFLTAGTWMTVVALIFMAFVAFGDWLEQHERRRRRELLREHRRRMDSLKPQRWT